MKTAASSAFNIKLKDYRHYITDVINKESSYNITEEEILNIVNALIPDDE